MGSINIGIGHDNYFIIAEFRKIILFLAYSSPQGRYDGSYFSARKHLIKASLFDIQYLSSQG